MTNLDQWEKGNNEYLSSAVAWLRLLLQERVGEPPSNPLLPKKTPTNAGWLHLRQIEKTEEPTPRPSTDKKTKSALAQAAVAMAEAEAMDPPPALTILSRRMGLSNFEQRILLLCAAVELDTRISSLCGQTQGIATAAYPTFALALTLFEQPSWDALSPERPLRYWKLIETTQSKVLPLTSNPLQVDERILHYIKGLNHMDDRLTPLFFPMGGTESLAELPQSQQRSANTILRYLGQTSAEDNLPVIQLLGTDSLSKQIVAGHVAGSLNLRLYRFSLNLFPVQPSEMETLIRLINRESSLSPFALYLEIGGSDKPIDEQLAMLNHFLARCNCVFFIDNRERWQPTFRSTLAIDIAKPTSVEQRAEWSRLLGEKASGSPEQLSAEFNLGIGEIRELARRTLAENAEELDLQKRLWDACVVASRPQLDTLAQRLDPKATWDDLVLPEHEINLLRQIVSQVRFRSMVYDEWGFREKMNGGLGISTLFSGPSGTGKTMAAEVIANDLCLNLYRIDLSAVVSKYIGETEKNLRRLFDAAEDGGVILFFDEADALFGKRSEVKDSHDRYANIEINYLLQRVEAFRGLAILATNTKSAIDQAFIRRLRFIVNFPFPSVEQRKLIWEKVFPANTPKLELDYDRLARFNITGGSIHNIALNAAFLSAQASTPVTMDLILTATRAELQKMEQSVNEADFRNQT